MILFYELTQIGVSHAPFTRAFIETAAHAFPDAALTLFAQRSHMEQALADLDPSLDARLARVPYQAPSDDPRNFVKLTMATLRFLHQTYGPLRDQKPQVLFLTGEPHHIWAAKLYRMWTPGFRCHLVLHGDIHSIRGPRSRNPLTRLRDYTSAIGSARHPDVRLIALETHIRDNIDAIIPGSGGVVDVIRIPCQPAQVDWQSPTPADTELRFGLLGIAGKSKGLDVFSRLALRARGGLARRAEFRLVGKLQKGSDQLDLGGIGGPLPFSSEFLSREVFDSELERLHYVVLPYNMDYYGLSASGVLLDVLAWRKPVIAFDTPVIRELVARFGDIGHICATEDEMADTVNGLLAGYDAQRYAAQRRNLDAAYRSRLPDATAADYDSMQQACWRPTLTMA